MLDQDIIWPPAGRYVVAVSGGADSMVLLHILEAAAASRHYDLVVAHLDHGLRSTSGADRQFVEAAAARLGLPCVTTAAHLKAGTSEAAARDVRHRFLEATRQAQAARAVVTAHHADDLLETSLLNLARGSGRRGLAPMQLGPILRPLLRVSRTGLRSYAARHGVRWQEDITNADTANPRNFVRHRLLNAASIEWRERYLESIHRLAKLNDTVDGELMEMLEPHQDGPTAYRFPRPYLRDLSLAETGELLLAAARQLQPSLEMSRDLVAAAAIFAKAGRLHSQKPLTLQLNVVVQTDAVRIYCTGISKVGHI